MSKPLRAMWLLNHTTARKFDVPMLKRAGVQEVFLPKIIPDDPSFRSGSIDWSEDAHLTIPRTDLDALNATNWYQNPPRDIWTIASKHFDLAFFIMLNGASFNGMVRHFDGAKIWRAFGLSNDTSYSKLRHFFEREGDLASFRGNNLWFGHAYEDMPLIEPHLLQRQSVYLPLGLSDASVQDEWKGTQPKVFLVLPELGFNTYYKAIYRDFKTSFDRLPYAVAGAQPVAIDDPNVLGYVTAEQHRQNMREFRVMYYPSTEQRHVHYHPFEAVQAGMPLIFLAGGLLDRLGGRNLPGRAATVKDARQKIERILSGDENLLRDIRQSQPILLESMKVENCEPHWRTGIRTILDRLADTRSRPRTTARRKRIAVLVPVAYRGGSLRGAKLLAQAIAEGSEAAGEAVDVVFGHLDDPASYPDSEFTDLPTSVKRRPFKWRVMNQAEARRAIAYDGGDAAVVHPFYQAPDDDISQFTDCDLWIVISDRLEHPLPPIRPTLLMVYDYLQRYTKFLDPAMNARFIERGKNANAVLVTTEFTARDAQQFGGVPANKVRRVPMLAPLFEHNPGRIAVVDPSYFVWTTNLGSHKNHVTALKALVLYYEKHGGKLKCRITGVGTKNIFKSDEFPHLAAIREIRRANPSLKNNVVSEGELSDDKYQRLLSQAAFLWHAAKIDNGTFSVVEAVSLGTPALSSDYPAMREIDQQFGLNLAWMDPNDPEDMARQLKTMEREFATARSNLPSQERLASQSVTNLASDYWSVIREYV